ncbi:unnamed protein product [Durusdinium trenchii]|uniref:LARP4/4B RNA recognition motif domain-containing protein n=1 Tax=Durusdinium trenchii TaxID=1381693 RepID=A0ABP0SGC2_9DINO
MAEEDREAKLLKVQEKLDFLMTKENLQEDSFIQMNMDAQMNIPICILAGHEQFEEGDVQVDVQTLYDAALRSQQVTVDKAAMQVKPIIKSKRNTVILHDLPDQIPLEELHELFEKCPCAEKLNSIKPDVNSTVFVTFEDDGAATDAALWLRSQKLRGANVKCSIKSQQFLRSFFPMKPVPNLQAHGVPAWAAAWSGNWALQSAWNEGQEGKGMEKGFKGGNTPSDPSVAGAPMPGAPMPGAPMPMPGAPMPGGPGPCPGGFGKGKGKGKSPGKGKEAKGMSPMDGAMGPMGGTMGPMGAMGAERMHSMRSEEASRPTSEARDDDDETSGYRHAFRRYTRQQIIEICGKMELVEKPESYKKIEADVGLFSHQPNKDWAPLPTPMGSFLGSESRRTDASDTPDESESRAYASKKERNARGSRSSEPGEGSQSDWDWEHWHDSHGWTENWYGRGKMQWVAKSSGDAEAEHHERGGSGASASGGWPRKPSWAEKVRGSTQKWQAKAKPPEDEPEEELKDEQKEEQKEEQRPSWADKVRHSLGH